VPRLVELVDMTATTHLVTRLHIDLERLGSAACPCR
jgi:ferredoxin-thioredoxin reductase catalytic subunit